MYPLAQRLKEAVTDLPRIAGDLPGIGGMIKAAPDHFQVEELLPYSPCGEGEHVFVTLRRAGWNTADVARCLGDAFKLKSVDIGWGGRKDRRALTTQTFSLRLPLDLDPDRIAATLASMDFDILSVQRHRNKLKTGHVAANRFRILVTGVDVDALPRAQSIAACLRDRGIPNYFGPQRFGRDMANLDRATHLMASRRPVRGKKDDFLVSALQSALFNYWLKERILRNDFSRILPGDVARKTDTGGLFVVDDDAEADERFRRGAVVFTGPIYGHKMMAANDTEGGYESAVLQHFGLEPDVFTHLRAPGTRRPAVLAAGELQIAAVDQGLEFSFILPSGAYATTVMREFMPGALP